LIWKLHEMKLAFVFTGHGTHRWNMGRQLIEEEPLFRETIEECDNLARQYVDWSIKEELLSDESESRIAKGDIQATQTCFFAIQVALANLWQSWGGSTGQRGRLLHGGGGSFLLCRCTDPFRSVAGHNRSKRPLQKGVEPGRHKWCHGLGILAEQ
jgi:hypothetical protein